MEIILPLAQVICIGIMTIYLLLAMYKRKYWSWWEKFHKSKEFLPTPPVLEYDKVGKSLAKKYYTRAAIAFIIYLLLLVVEIKFF